MESKLPHVPLSSSSNSNSVCINKRRVQTVAKLFVAKHGRDWIVADIVADSESPQEQFHSQVLVDSVVDNHAMSLTGRQ